MTSVLIFLIKAYQAVVSPLFPSSCRFSPTCSSYARQAIEKYGTRKGVLLGVRRLLRCHPYNPGGFDPLV